MNRRRLAKTALPLAPILLVLAACGAGHGEAGKRHEGPPSPLGYELAMVDGGADEASTASAPLR